MNTKSAFFIMVVVAILLAGCAGTTGEVKAQLGKEFSLSLGQTAVISGENLEITFEEVLEDSRCPKGVVCIWAGRVRCLVQITKNDSSEKVELTEPGNNDQYSSETFKIYQFAFNVIPYPDIDKEIEESEYRMLMTINKFGILEGTVDIGPLSPVEQPGEKPPVPCEVYQARKIMVYDKNGRDVVTQVDIDCDGRYRVELKPGIYIVDINRIGIDSSGDVPRQVEIMAGLTFRLDIAIDTGIR